MKWNLTLVADGAPALLNDRWLLRITANRPQEPVVTHELEVTLNPSVPPAVPVDFLWIFWRVAAPGAPIHVLTHAAALPVATTGGPAGPVLASYGFLHPEATWLTRRGAVRQGVAFQLDVFPVYRPEPRD